MMAETTDTIVKSEIVTRNDTPSEHLLEAYQDDVSLGEPLPVVDAIPTNSDELLPINNDPTTASQNYKTENSIHHRKEHSEKDSFTFIQ